MNDPNLIEALHDIANNIGTLSDCVHFYSSCIFGALVGILTVIAFKK